jgi:DNA helicase II / ATP-dependent DNA helicase PcrA
MKCKVILGPPGTGKTTTLLNLVEKFLAEGIPPEKIGFISFTKKSVTEAVDRAVARFKLNRDRFIYFRTIHSLAFRQLGMTIGDVMQKVNFQELGASIGLEIRGKQADDIFDLVKGDQIVTLESLARLRQEDLRAVYDETFPDFTWEELELYRKTLEAYKKSKYLYDFTDMLTRYLTSGARPELDVLIVDEAQDLCALQWRIVEALSAHAGQTFIAGDDDQAIFRWSGADVDYFISLSELPQNEVQVLQKSYRLTSNVFKVAHDISEQIRQRVDKVFYCRSEEGSVDYVDSLDGIDMSKGKWLLLIRNGYMEKQVIADIRSCGYAYIGRWETSSDSPVVQAALAWEKLRTGAAVPPEKIVHILHYINHDPTRKKRLQSRGDEPMTKAEFVNIFTLPVEEPWHEALTRISPEERAYLLAARRRGETFVGVPRIRISTIHGAKGGEEENVVVFLDISQRTWRSMQNNPDDERRVFYVAMTRAKQNLFIVEPSTCNYFPI